MGRCTGVPHGPAHRRTAWAGAPAYCMGGRTGVLHGPAHRRTAWAGAPAYCMGGRTGVLHGRAHRRSAWDGAPAYCMAWHRTRPCSGKKVTVGDVQSGIHPAYLWCHCCAIWDRWYLDGKPQVISGPPCTLLTSSLDPHALHPRIYCKKQSLSNICLSLDCIRGPPDVKNLL